MYNVKIKITNNHTNNTLDYDLSELPNLNQLNDQLWNNFLDYLISYTSPQNKTYSGPRKFKIELSNSDENPAYGINGLIYNDLTQEEVVDFVRYIKAYIPSREYSKSIRLHKAKR